MKKITFYLVLFCGAIVNAQNNSLNFDGGDDTVDLGQNFDFSVGDTFTLEAWIYIQNGPGFRQIISKLGSEDGIFRGWGLQITNDKLLSGFVSESFTINSRYVEGTLTLEQETWYHVAMTYNSDSSVSLFINGVSEPLSLEDYVGQNTTINTAALASIGSYEGGDFPRAEFFRGYIDDVRIWSTSRTQEEIAADYTTELSGNEVNLIGYYKMDIPNSSCDVQDCSINQTHGTRLGTNSQNELPQFSDIVPDIEDVACGAENDCELGLDDVQALNVSIAPNPAFDRITFSGLEGNNPRLKIFDILGNLVKEEVIQNNRTTISELVSGVYLAQITSSNRSSIVKFIKK